jgi:hypothetical protein
MPEAMRPSRLFALKRSTGSFHLRKIECDPN